MPIARDRKGVLVLVASMGAVMVAGAVAGAVAALSPGGVSDGGTRPYRLVVPATAAGLPLDRSQTEAYGTVDMELSDYSRQRYEAELGGDITGRPVGAVYADPADDRLVVFRGLTGSGSAICTPPAHDIACVSMTSTTIVFIEFAPAEPAETSPIRPERALEILHGVRAAVEQPA
ncbi:hypothetical protein amrb99_12050 [Actinomadura sp. RB99]|uniref:hypothetical protein n=1 Tax=Actinomadura sp. RB99 TaxID=2691577 RepID=UPI001687C606|nr:hypothetical protein [Actinomadura sp. RB99]MBD2892295.1 hypothetical protein [Actinomadura sp. RB99]